MTTNIFADALVDLCRVHAPAGRQNLGFDLALHDLAPATQPVVLELIEGRALDAVSFCGQWFIKTADLDHFTSGDGCEAQIT